MGPLFRVDFIFCLVVAGIPAYFINRYLLQLVRPKESVYRFMAYLVIILATAFLYVFIFSWVVMKYYWKEA